MKLKKKYVRMIVDSANGDLAPSDNSYQELIDKLTVKLDRGKKKKDKILSRKKLNKALSKYVKTAMKADLHPSDLNIGLRMVANNILNDLHVEAAKAA